MCFFLYPRVVPKANTKLGQTLYQMAISGEHPAVTIFCAKVRLHMHEKAPFQPLDNQKVDENHEEDSKAVTDELARLTAARDAAAVPEGTEQKRAEPDSAIPVEKLESSS